MPIVDTDDIYIESVSARTLDEAKEKFLRKIESIYDLDTHSDFEELENDEEFIYLNLGYGEIYDIESF